MIGHMPLIEIRKAGKAPKAVWIWVGMDGKKWAASWADFEDTLAHPKVCIEDKDRIDQLDLRFLVGMQVHIDGNDDRVLEAHLASLKAGAKDVFTLWRGELVWDRGEGHGASASRPD